MNFWERIKDMFKEIKKEDIIFNENGEVIDVNVSGHYEYKIRRDSIYDDYIVMAFFEARAKCQVEGTIFSKLIDYGITVARGEDKLEAFNNFKNMTEEEKDETLMDKLKTRLQYDIKNHLEVTLGKDIDKAFKDMGVKTINLNVQIEKDKITKK